MAEERGVFKIKNWLENLLMVSRLILASHLGNVQKNTDFLFSGFVAKVQNKYGLDPFKPQKVPNRSETQEKVQEPATESYMTILFLKISALSKTMKLTSSAIMNKILGSLYYISKFEEKADKKFKYTKHDKFPKKALICYLHLCKKFSNLYL